MLIQAEKWIVTNKTNGISYKIKNIEKCCDKILNSPNISLNNEKDDDNQSINSNINNYSVKLKRNESSCCDGEIYEETYYESISHCFHCGEPIQIKIVDIVDKTEEYNQLETQIKKLQDIRYNTDSKKKERELANQIWALNRQMTKILQSDDFERECDD